MSLSDAFPAFADPAERGILITSHARINRLYFQPGLSGG
jgi:hypothetical protein